MLNTLRNRWEQGYRTNKYPKESIELLPRYRGLPAVKKDAPAELAETCASACPQDAIDAGARVIGMVAIFDYGFDVAQKNFKDSHVELTTLSDYDNLLEQALETNFINTKQLTTLKNWRQDPAEWNAI